MRLYLYDEKWYDIVVKNGGISSQPCCYDMAGRLFLVITWIKQKGLAVNQAALVMQRQAQVPAAYTGGHIG